MHSSFGIALIFCAAWVAISKHGIIGPFWFENANQERVTVRKERYIEVLNKLCGALGLLSRGRGRNRVQRDIQWFQQDGAPPHTANITLDWLDHKFPNRLISRKREPEWSPPPPPIPRILTPQISTCGGSLRIMCTGTILRPSLSSRKQ